MIKLDSLFKLSAFLMKKSFKVLFYLAAGLFSVLLVGRILGFYMVYKIPTGASRPTIEIGDVILVSKLKKVERFELTVYEAEVPDMGIQPVLHRLVGLPGDEIAILNGDLFVNGRNVDAQFDLLQEFRLPNSELEKLEKAGIKTDDVYVEQNDSINAFLSSSQVRQFQLNAIRYIIPPSRIDSFIQKNFPESKNQDQFGPIRIPKDHYFMLGDNRHNSYDSRYSGLVSKDKIVAVYFYKF